MISQKELTRKHLHEHGAITSWEAIQEYHITRLAAVISLLRDDGYIIDTVPQYTANEDGKRGRRYALYVLRKERS